ncbi:MAG TPA: hypothetical protein P5282_06400 [Anaerolineaceae bacterium]|nr:hypothetical protein [Anaerolineaceae bacterium]
MSEVTLKNGKVVHVDVSSMTVAEWRNFVSPRGTIADENAVVVKCTGLSIEEIEKLPYQEFRRIVKAIVRDAREPLGDPS